MEDNKAWLEQAEVLFEIGIAEGNYEECKNIIDTLREEGFAAEAKTLHTALLEETLGTFLVEFPEKLK